MSGVSIEEVYPSVPSQNLMFMLEGMTYKVTLRDQTPSKSTVQAWTNQYDADHSDGKWHAVDLDLLKSSPDGTLNFYGKSVIITSDRDFRFTFRYRLRDGDDWTWSHPYMVDGEVHVESPRLYDSWTQGPDFTHILETVYLGNFIAATNARQCNFTHVLNVADSLDMVYSDDDKVVYKKIAMKDGAHNPIEPELVKQAVDWLFENNKDNNRILVNCRAGIGRAGSVGVAFVYARKPEISFEEAKEQVLSKRFIYPHAGLKETLAVLFKRNQNH